MTRFADRYPDLVRSLRKRYGENHRHYHDWSHVEALLAEFDHIGWDDPAAAEIALYYHDAIWRPGATDNEAESAALLRRELDGRAPVGTIDRAVRIVLATATHVVADATPRAEADDIARFLDMDLSILGAPEAVFETYDRAIRQEFADQPDEVYRPRRAAVMRSFLERRPIYRTAAFRASHEERARRNLSRLIERLTGEVPEAGP